MRLPRFTTRRLMVLVAVVAAALAAERALRVRQQRMAQASAYAAEEASERAILRAIERRVAASRDGTDPARPEFLRACLMNADNHRGRAEECAVLRRHYVAAARAPGSPSRPNRLRSDPPITDPSPWEIAYLRLHRSGWTIGDTAFAKPPGVVWCVYGRNGENVIRAEGRTRDEAWWDAIGQARAVGMLGE